MFYKVFLAVCCLLVVNVMTAEAQTALGTAVIQIIEQLKSLLAKIPLLSNLAGLLNPILDQLEKIASTL